MIDRLVCKSNRKNEFKHQDTYRDINGVGWGGTVQIECGAFHWQHG